MITLVVVIYIVSLLLTLGILGETSLSDEVAFFIAIIPGVNSIITILGFVGFLIGRTNNK